MAWYEEARIFYDWVNYGQNITETYADWLIEKTLGVHANALTFCAVVGGYALWDSKVTPKYEQMGEVDLLGALAQRCRDQGLRFIPWWLATATGGARRVLEEHPSWQQMGPPRDGQEGERYNYVCYNSPYRELLYEEVREVLTNYQVDGVYFDQLPISCYCAWCQAKFEKRYGGPMPFVTDEYLVYDSPAGFPPLLRAFRDDSVRSFAAGIREIIDTVQPEVCYAQNWVRNHQAHLVRGLADVVLPEFYQKNDLVPLGLRHRLTKAYFDHGTIWGNVRHGVRHDARHFPLRGTKMLLMDCLANHSVPVMLDLCAMDYDPTGMEDLAQTFDHMKEVQGVLAQSEPYKYAALLHSYPSHLFDRKRFEDAFEGLYRLLLEFHLPFEVVNEEGIQRGELAKYSVLVLPDVMAIANETVAAINAACDGGMGLVASFMTGFYDDSGRRRAQPAFSERMGVRIDDVVAWDTREGIASHPVLKLGDIDGSIFHYGSLKGDHELMAGFSEGRTFSFQGGHVLCEASSDSLVIAEVHAMDMVKLNSPVYNRRGHYPGPPRWPLLVVREVEGRRTVYLSPQAESEWRRRHAPELDQVLLRSILWAGGDPFLKTIHCPRSVEVRVFHSEERQVYLIMLINLTTNPLTQADDFNPGVIRYVTPHNDVRLVVRIDEKVTGVRSLIGSEVELVEQAGEVTIRLPQLDLYESLLVEYE